MFNGKVLQLSRFKSPAAAAIPAEFGPPETVGTLMSKLIIG